MQLPEITIANQSFRKVGFLNASHVEVFLDGSFMGGTQSGLQFGFVLV
jgi:hypothetical protein